MQSKLKRLVVIVAVVLVAYFAQVEVNSYLGRKALQESGLTVHTLAEALPKAEAEGKQVLADLSAIWCPGCRKFDRTVLSDPGVKAAIAKGYVFARIEYETEEGTAFQKRYQVQGFPTVLVLDSQGNALRQLQTNTDPAGFIAQLQQSQPQ